MFEPVPTPTSSTSLPRTSDQILARQGPKTRLSMNRYFEPLKPERSDWSLSARVGYRRGDAFDLDPVDTDVYAIHVKRLVSVTPLSLDLTSRVILKDLDNLLRQEAEKANCRPSQ